MALASFWNALKSRRIRGATLEQSLLGNRHPGIAWGLEGTGVYGRAFAKALVAAGMAVFEVPGAVTKRHRRCGTRHGKTDSADARAIAEAVLRESDRLPQFHEIEEREALRLRYDQRDRLIRERTVLINRLRSSALRLGMKAVPANLTSRVSLFKLAKVLGGTAGHNAIENALIEEMTFSIRTLQSFATQVAHLERMLPPVVRRLCPELLQLHGVSTVVAAGLVGHAGDLRNFRNADAFAMHSATGEMIARKVFDETTVRATADGAGDVRTP